MRDGGKNEVIGAYAYLKKGNEGDEKNKQK